MTAGVCRRSGWWRRFCRGVDDGGCLFSAYGPIYMSTEKQTGKTGRREHWRGGKRRKEYKRIIHSKRWNALRTAYIGSHPFCEECMARGIMDQPAEEVHHVRPIGTGRSWEEMCALAFDAGNLRSLCHDCHVAAHRRQRKEGKGGKEPSEDVKAWLDRFLHA